MRVPDVSIVLPTYNRAKHLPRSVSSVLKQSFQDFELVIVDDGSTDNTREVIAAFEDSRIRYVPRTANGGVAAARNTGVHEAQGRLISFQDSDDEWLLEKLSLQMASLKGSGQDAMSVCGVLRNGKRPGGQGQWLLSYPRRREDWDQGLDHLGVLRSTVAYTQSWLVPRQAILDVGGFDERLRIWDDWDLLIRLSMRLHLRTVYQPLVISGRIDDSISGDALRFIHDMALIQQKYADDMRRYPAISADLLYHHGVRLCKAGQLTEGRSALIAAIRRDPLRSAPWRLLLRSGLGRRHMAWRFRHQAGGH